MRRHVRRSYDISRSNPHPVHPKQRRGGEKMFVIRMDFGEPRPDSGGEMNRVSSADVGGDWHHGEDLLDVVENRVDER